MSVNQGLYEDFYVQLGLDLSTLETGLANAGMTIEQNVRRLNHESNLIRLRTEVEIAGLDEVADAERILQTRQEALNRQMEIQRDRVRLLDAQLQHLTQTYGAESSEAQRTATRLERARLSLANLEREARNLSETQEETNSGLSDLSGILALLPPQLRAVAVGMTAVGTGAGMAGKSVEALLEDFRELQTQAYELNMSVGKTRDFLQKLRLGGGDISDIEGYIRGITDALVKGDVDDPEFIGLSKYDAQIIDATGRLKDFEDVFNEVYQAWKKADEAGEGIEFLQLTGGEMGVRDMIQIFKRLKEAEADAQKVMKAGIDDSQLHELDRAMKLVEVQAGELKNALGDIFVPAAQTAAESFFETLHKGTELLVENKDEIQRWGFIAKEAFSTAGDKISGAFEAAGKKIAEVNEMISGKTGDSRVDKILGDMSWRYGDAKPAFGIDQMISGQVDDAKKSFGVLDDVMKKAEQAQAEYNEELKKTAEQLAETDKKLDKNPLNQYALQRVQQFKDELADLRIELDFDDEFEKAQARLNQWFDREFNRKIFLSDEEKNAIENLYAAKQEQIQRQVQAAHDALNEKIRENFQNAADIEFELTHSAYEKELRDIEKWKEAQQEKADTAEEIAGIVAEAAAKEAQAFEREVDRIKGVTQSLEDEIFDMEHSQYSSDIRRAMQKYQKALDEGVDFSVAQRWLNDKFGQFNKRAKESRATGGDYTKNPNGTQSAIQWNGFSLGFPTLQRGIGLMTDENQIRSRLISTLDDEARASVERMQSLKDMVQSMSFPQMSIPDMLQGVPVGNTTIINGDELSQISIPDLKAEMEKYQSQIAQYMQIPTPDISQYMPPQSSVQLPAAQETVTFETIVTPLNNIGAKLDNILSALNERKSAQINVSPSISNNLGGAYVFDNAMKKQLVDDITSDVVDEITQAVTQATSRANYSYGS